MFDRAQLILVAAAEEGLAGARLASSRNRPVARTQVVRQAVPRQDVLAHEVAREEPLKHRAPTSGFG
jgi:hypothetical protein